MSTEVKQFQYCCFRREQTVAVLAAVDANMVSNNGRSRGTMAHYCSHLDSLLQFVFLALRARHDKCATLTYQEVPLKEHV